MWVKSVSKPLVKNLVGITVIAIIALVLVSNISILNATISSDRYGYKIIIRNFVGMRAMEVGVTVALVYRPDDLTIWDAVPGVKWNSGGEKYGDGIIRCIFYARCDSEVVNWVVQPDMVKRELQWSYRGIVTRAYGTIYLNIYRYVDENLVLYGATISGRNFDWATLYKIVQGLIEIIRIIPGIRFR
jgi:hypothetical protein